MNAPDDNTTASRPVLPRFLVKPLEYRHPRAFAGAHYAFGTYHGALGALALHEGHRRPSAERHILYGCAALLLVFAACNISIGHHLMTFSGSASPEPERAALAFEADRSKS